MSELKVYSQCYDGTDGLFYLKSEADKVIADLEESHKMEVEQLLIEIAELKYKLQNVSELLKETREWLIESQKMHQRCADNASKQIRRLKRALYKVCDNWAVCEMDYWRKCLEHYEDYFNVRTDEDLTEEKCERMIDNWRKVAHNCRAKAEDYK